MAPAPTRIPARFRRPLSVLGYLALFAAVALGLSAWQSRRLLPSSSPAPALSLPSLEGERVDLESLRGRPVVIYFFAPWCGVCRHASSNVAALRRARSDDDLAIVAVALAWESRDDVVRFAREHELDLPVLLGDERVLADYRIGSFPTFYFLDREGRVRSRTVGYTTRLGLRLRSR